MNPHGLMQAFKPKILKRLLICGTGPRPDIIMRNLIKQVISNVLEDMNQQELSSFQKVAMNNAQGTKVGRYTEQYLMDFR
jgi:hypothetical protein